jgi:hypothetical protein
MTMRDLDPSEPAPKAKPARPAPKARPVPRQSQPLTTGSRRALSRLEMLRILDSVPPGLFR